MFVFAVLQGRSLPTLSFSSAHTLPSRRPLCAAGLTVAGLLDELGSARLGLEELLDSGRVDSLGGHFFLSLQVRGWV